MVTQSVKRTGMWLGVLGAEVGRQVAWKDMFYVVFKMISNCFKGKAGNEPKDRQGGHCSVCETPCWLHRVSGWGLAGRGLWWGAGWMGSLVEGWLDGVSGGGLAWGLWWG